MKHNNILSIDPGEEEKERKEGERGC